MSDGIKEILDNLIVNETTGMCYLSKKLTKQIEDCITNLQQENKRLEENNQAMQEEMAKVWQKNEKLKEKLNCVNNNPML